MWCVCGRYAASANPDDLVAEFEVERVDEPERMQPDWNVAPTKDVPAVLTRRDRSEPEDVEPLRLLRPVRWGLVPSWAKDPSIGSRMINARMETVAQKPAFRRAFAKRRCLLPADGYYEWYAAESGPKQPFFISGRDGHPLAMAGIYEFWRDPAADPESPDVWLWSCAVLTTTAEDEVGRIHDRMPLLVPRERWGEWLDPSNDDTGSAVDLLVPAAPGGLAAWPVSRKVNNVRNSGPELVEPLPPEGVPSAVADDSGGDDALF
jgi:putative SOS response-associated peptidase YedK